MITLWRLYYALGGNFRPSKIEDCVLPADLKKTFAEFVKKNYVPNLLLTGGPGVGKTTVARAMLE